MGVGSGAGPAGAGRPGGGLPGPASPANPCIISAGTSSLSLPSVSPKAFTNEPIAFIMALPCSVCGPKVCSVWVNFLMHTCTSARAPASLPCLGCGVIIGLPPGPGVGGAPPGGLAPPVIWAAICGGTLIRCLYSESGYNVNTFYKKAAGCPTANAQRCLPERALGPLRHQPLIACAYDHDA